jgi:hypothetical protein
VAAEVAGAAATGATLLASCGIGVIREPPALATLAPLAVCIAAGIATGIVEAPFWQRAWIARMIRIPVIELVVLWQPVTWPRVSGLVGPDPALAALAAVAFFLWWIAIKELAARRSGVLLLALGISAGGTAALAAASGATVLAGPSLALAILFVLGVPFAARVPRAVAGRGPLAPALVALVATWLMVATVFDGFPDGAREPFRGSLLLLAAAPLAPALACAPARLFPARAAAALSLLLAAALAAAALLVAHRGGAW